jgi:glycosyltransferase involved in cell wall biosynthesis
MKVVFITHYTTLYGANRSLLNLIDGLKCFKVKSFVLCPSEGEITKALERRKVPFFIFPFKLWMSSPLKMSKKMPFTFVKLKYYIKNILFNLKIIQFRHLAFNLIALPFLIIKIKRWNVDIVYTNSSVTQIGASIAMILKKPHVWHIREFGNLDCQLEYDWGRKHFEKLLNKADAIIAISKAIKEDVLNNIHSKIYIVYNGVISKTDCNISKERAFDFNIPSNYTFAIVGILHPNKGQDQAIRALALLKKDYPNTRLIIVGSGSDEHLEYLKKLCCDLEVGNQVEFLGYISNPFEAYLKADAILMCSKFEAMGRVTAEAMAVARPVIGYNNGGTAEIIKDEVTGLLYNEDYKDLAKCMTRFVENPKWAKELGINGWQKAQKEFTVEVYAKKVYKVLKEIMNKNNKKK